MPDNPIRCIERVAVKAGKTPYVRFDLNDYSIPHTQVRRLLTVLADPDEVRIVDGAADPRPPSPQLRQGRPDRGRRAISRPWSSTNAPPAATAAPTASLRRRPPAKTLLLRAAERGSNLGSITAALLRLLDRYGAAELDAAIIEALDARRASPKRCASPLSAAASSASSRRPSPSICPTMSRRAMPTCSRTGSNPMTSSRSTR